MRVALIHDLLIQAGGAEKVLEAFHEIWPKAQVYTLVYNQKNFSQYKHWKIKTSFIQKLPFSLSHYRWYLALMPTAIESFNLYGYDLVISDSSAFSKGVLTHQRTPHVCYCHSPTRYLWSDSYEYFKNLRGKERIFRKILPLVLTQLRLWDENASCRPDYFIANSQFTAQRIKKYYHREVDAVIYPPVEVDKFYFSSEQGNYFLIIARPRQYKRIDLAIQAFNELKIPLKVVGINQKEGKRFWSTIKPNIEFLGYLSEEKKAEYLSRCQALIFPQEEDFGIVAVEAMASGRPVIAFRAGGALETVVENVTGVFFDKQSWGFLADAVLHFQVKNFDPQKICQHAQQFSKERFKKEIQDFIRRII